MVSIAEASHRIDRRRRGSRATTWLIIALCAAIVLSLSTQATAGPEHPHAEELALRDCLLSGVSFEDDRNRLETEGWIPDGYQLVAGNQRDAIVLVWTFQCEQAAVERAHRPRVRQRGSVAISVIGVAVDTVDDNDPSSWPSLIAPGFPGNWGVYVVAVHSDDRAATRFLRRAGLPATTVREIAFGQTFDYDQPAADLDLPSGAATCDGVAGLPGAGHDLPQHLQEPEATKQSRVHVDARSPYHIVTEPWIHHNTVTHCHDQMFMHGPAANPSRLQVSIPEARDHFCQAPAPSCGSALAEPGSWLAQFLGNNGVRTDTHLTFDHEPIPLIMMIAQ